MTDESPRNARQCSAVSCSVAYRRAVRRHTVGSASTCPCNRAQLERHWTHPTHLYVRTYMRAMQCMRRLAVNKGRIVKSRKKQTQAKQFFKMDPFAGETSSQTVQYSTVQYSTVQYSTVQYSTVQYVKYLPAIAPATEFATVPARLDRVVNIAYEAPNGDIVWSGMVCCVV